MAAPSRRAGRRADSGNRRRRSFPGDTNRRDSDWNERSRRTVVLVSGHRAPESVEGLLPWWEPSQYVQDVTSGNSTVPRVIRALLVGLFNRFQRANARLLPRFCLVRGCKRYPFIEGKATSGSTPTGSLGLQPGEIVEIKSEKRSSRLWTRTTRRKGFGLTGRCSSTADDERGVLRRIEKIIDEKTGRMLKIKRDTVILEGVICAGDYHRSCPRAIYPTGERPG